MDVLDMLYGSSPLILQNKTLNVGYIAHIALSNRPGHLW